MIRLFFKRRGRRSRLEIAYAISLPAWLYTLLGNNISSGSPDVTSSCLMIQLFLTFAAFIMTVDKAERAQLFGTLLLLGAICLCVKLNTLGMVAGVWGVAMIFLILEKDILLVPEHQSTGRSCRRCVLDRMLGLSGSAYKRLSALSIASDRGLCCMEDEGKRRGPVP